MSQNRVRSRGRTSCCSHAKIEKPPPPPPSFKPPPLPDEEDSIFIRPITRTRSPNPNPDASDMPRYLSAQSGSSSRSLSPVYKITHDSFIDGKKLSQAAGEERIEKLEDENKSNNGHQESSKLSKDFQETEKDVIQSVEEKKEHSMRNVIQTSSSSHSKENIKHVPKPSTKSLAKPSENENRVEVAEETFVKTTNKKSLNKSTSEGKKPDLTLDNGIQHSKPPKHAEEKKVEVVEEPFIEEFAYETTKQISPVESHTTKENNTDLLDNMLTKPSSVEVVKEPIIEEVAYKTSQNKASELKPAEGNNIDSSNGILPNENRVEVVEEPFIEEFAYKTTNLETSPIETSNEVAKSTGQKSEKHTSISEKVNPLTIKPVVVPEMTIVPATPPVIHDTSKVFKDNLENSDNEEGYPTEIFPPQVEKQLKKKKKKKLVEVRRVKKEKPGEVDEKGWPKQIQNNSIATNEDIPASRSGSVSSVIKESEAGKNKAVVSTNNLDNKHTESSCSAKTKESDAKSSEDAYHQDNKLEENRQTGHLNINCESIAAKKNDTDIINGNLIEKTPQEKHDELSMHEQIDIAGPTANQQVTESKENRIKVIEEPFVETVAYTTTSNGFGEQREEMLEEPHNETTDHKTNGERVQVVEEPFVESFAYITTSAQIAKEDAIENAIENVKVPFGKTLTTGDKDAFNDSGLKSDILSEKVKSKALANTIESLPFLKTHDNIADLTVETIQDYFSKQDPVKSEETSYTDQNNVNQSLQRQEQSQKKITSKVLSTADSDSKYCKLAENMPTISHGVTKIENKNSIAPPPPPPPPPSETQKFNKDNHENMTKPPSLSLEETNQRRQRQKPAYESKKDKQIAQIKEFLKGPDGEANQVKMPQVRLKQTGKDKDCSVLTCLAPHLYLGTSRAVLEANLPQHGVTCVVSAGPLKEAARRDGVEVFNVVVADDQDLPNHFTAVADRLEKERASGGAAVVQSGSDCTHAAMLAMAWMVKHGGKSVEEASQVVADRRPAARLKNGNFVRLQEWHKGAAGGTRGMADVATSWLPLLVYLLVVFVSLKFMLGALIKMAGGDKEPELNSTEMYSYFDVYRWP